MTAGTPREGARPGRAFRKKGCLSGSLGDTHMFTQVARGCPGQGISTRPRRREPSQCVWGTEKSGCNMGCREG